MLLRQAIPKFMRDYFSRRELAAETQTAYGADLAQFLSFAGTGAALDGLDRNLVERWASRLRREAYSPATIRRRLMALRAFCTYWAREGGLAESPFWRMELSSPAASPPPRTLTAEELRALVERSQAELAEAPALSGSPSPSEPGFRALRDLALVELMTATGMRVGEVSALDAASFNADRGTLAIAGPRRRRREIAALSAAATDTLRRYAAARGKVETRETAFFINAQRGRLSTQGISNILAGLRRRAGVTQHVTPIMLRHTMERDLLSQGVDVRVVLAFLGKSTLTTEGWRGNVTKGHAAAELSKFRPPHGRAVIGARPAGPA